MKVCEFASQMHSTIERFKDYWIEMRERNPQFCAEELAEEEWIKHLIAWVETEHVNNG